MAVSASISPNSDAQSSPNDARRCPSCGREMEIAQSNTLERIARLKRDIAVAVYDGRENDAVESHSELVAAEMWLAGIRKGTAP